MYKYMPVLISLLIVLLSPTAIHAESSFSCCPLHCLEERVLFLKSPPMTGEDVEVLQKELKATGYYKQTIDGIFGETTHHAVISFQEARGLQPSGMVDESTWQSLNDALELPVSVTKPEPPAGRVSILIDTTRRILTIMSDGQPYKQYPVAVGKYSTPSPIGTWRITNMGRHWGTGFGTRWMGLSVPWGTYGIHGTNRPGSIGSYASHGCIRMNNHHVEEIFPWISSGVPVMIIGNPFEYEPGAFRIIRRGSRGSDVLEVQRLLKRLGYYNGPRDGIWGWGMEKAINDFRKDKELPADNSVDRQVYEKLGIL